MKDREIFIKVSEAKRIAEEAGFNITGATVINLVRKYEMGAQPRGYHTRIYIRKSSWMNLIEEWKKTLHGVKR